MSTPSEVAAGQAKLWGHLSLPLLTTIPVCEYFWPETVSIFSDLFFQKNAYISKVQAIWNDFFQSFKTVWTQFHLDRPSRIYITAIMLEPAQSNKLLSEALKIVCIVCFAFLTSIKCPGCNNMSVANGGGGRKY